MDKKEAAKFLGLSEKTIERYKASGKLPARLRRIVGNDGKTRKVLDFEQSDVERLKRELSGEVVYPDLTGGQPQTKTRTDIDTRTSTDTKNSENTGLLTLGQPQTKTQTDTDIQTQTANPLDIISARVGDVVEKHLEVFRAGGKLLLNINDCRLLTGLSDASLRDAIRSGNLKGQKIGRGYKIKRDDLDQYINKL
jgi:excisionase family DNA binding protein